MCSRRQSGGQHSQGCECSGHGESPRGLTRTAVSLPGHMRALAGARADAIEAQMNGECGAGPISDIRRAILPAGALARPMEAHCEVTYAGGRDPRDGFR